MRAPAPDSGKDGANYFSQFFRDLFSDVFFSKNNDYNYNVDPINYSFRNNGKSAIDGAMDGFLPGLVSSTMAPFHALSNIVYGPPGNGPYHKGSLSDWATLGLTAATIPLGGRGGAVSPSRFTALDSLGGASIATGRAATPFSVAAKGAPIDIAANEAAWARAAATAEGPYSLVGANRAVIDPRKLTEYALNPAHPVGGNKARVFDSAFGFNSSNADDLMLQLRQGVMNSPATLGKVDQYGTRLTVDIPAAGPTGSGLVRTGWIYRPGSNTPELTTLFPK